MKEIRQSGLAAMLAAVFLAAGAAGCQTDRPGRTVGTTIDDATLTARVKTQLMKADNLNWNDINVNTYRGTVSLSGFVPTEEMAERAVKAAQSVEGVQAVKNDMRVQPAKQ
ncbi:MAG TPA: BON domain-containing protein [Burkholderiaceae bacterium]|nr:BON domain-containing protein [Burkholderiaceae bacterium]